MSFNVESNNSRFFSTPIFLIVSWLIFSKNGFETNIFFEDFPFFKNKSGTKFVSNSKEEIECLINNVTETRNVLDSFINNLEAIKDKIEKREKKLLKYEENKANVRNLKNELNKLYEILEL